MKPILYESTETEFTSNGLGRLSEATECTVTEERNGIYELSMQIPVTAKHFPEVRNTRLILAKPNAISDPQPFEIYDISTPMGGIVDISARHISYRLSDIPCKPFYATSALEVMERIKANAMDDCPFDFWTDKNTVANYTQNIPASIRERLGGVEGSVLDVYGGEYEFDRFTVKLWNHRGRNRGVTIRYGKNLTDAKQEQSIADTCTGIVGYWQNEEDGVVYTDPVYSDNADSFPFHKIKVIDFSNEYQTKPAVSVLTARVKSYIASNGIGTPDVSIDTSFIDLADTEEYKDLSRELIGLCDTVTVLFGQIGINNTAEVTKTEYDVLNERYNSITLGTYYSLASTINGIDANVRQAKKDLTSDLQKAKENATKQITGANGGYVRLNLDESGNPYEILIMDTDNVETAKKVWRWNQGGLGYSSTGYNGPYTLAMTQDGAIVADFITTGTLNANIIRAGILSDKAGNNFWNLETGEFQLKSVASISDYADEKTEINNSISSVKKAAIKSVDVEYALSESDTAAPAGGWQTDAPQWKEGYYIWQRTVTTAADDTVSISDALCITGVKGETGEDGQDAILLIVDSTNGNLFKNSEIATILNVTIITGDTTITDSAAMKSHFGDDSKLIWYTKGMGETEWSEVDSSDSRLNDGGFLFTINPKDVETKCQFRCELDA